MSSLTSFRTALQTIILESSNFSLRLTGDSASGRVEFGGFLDAPAALPPGIIAPVPDLDISLDAPAALPPGIIAPVPELGDFQLDDFQDGAPSEFVILPFRSSDIFENLADLRSLLESNDLDIDITGVASLVVGIDRLRVNDDLLNTTGTNFLRDRDFQTTGAAIERGSRLFELRFIDLDLPNIPTFETITGVVGDSENERFEVLTNVGDSLIQFDLLTLS